MVQDSDDIIKSVLGETFSDEHLAVIDQLSEPIYDEDIADKLGIKATIVRTLLNDLHEASLVEYQRTKNKRTGWYTYKWLRREDKITDHVRNYLRGKRDKLQEKIDKDAHGLSFKCDCRVVSYSDAMERNFRCSECDCDLSEYQDIQAVEEIVAEITKIDSILEQTYHSA